MEATSEQREDVRRRVRAMADEAEALGADCEDTKGYVSAIVRHHGAGFNAWFCVCCELADREARRDGFKDALDKAFSAKGART